MGQSNNNEEFVRQWALTDLGNGTAALSGTPDDNDVGLHLVELRVTDTAGAYAEQKFGITVVEKPRYDINIPLVFKDRAL